MHYFVVSGSDPSTVHIIAEIVRDTEDGDRGDSLAGQLAGPRLRVLTQDEIMTIPGGAKVLDRWRSGDDGRFHLESVRLARETDRIEHRSTLRLVAADGPPDQGRLEAERLSTLLERAVDPQAQSLKIMQLVKEGPAQLVTRKFERHLEHHGEDGHVVGDER
jgi:hypothetical protein